MVDFEPTSTDPTSAFTDGKLPPSTATLGRLPDLPLRLTKPVATAAMAMITTRTRRIRIVLPRPDDRSVLR